MVNHKDSNQQKEIIDSIFSITKIKDDIEEIDEDIDEDYINNLFSKFNENKIANREKYNKCDSNNMYIDERIINLSNQSNSVSCREMARSCGGGMKTVKFEFNPF